MEVKMGKITETNDHLTRKKGNPGIVHLRGKNITTNIERPFSILSKAEKNKVLQYCVERAYKFYTSNNSQF